MMEICRKIITRKEEEEMYDRYDYVPPNILYHGVPQYLVEYCDMY